MKKIVIALSVIVALASCNNKETEKNLPLFDKYIDLPRRIYLYFSIANAHFFSKNYKSTTKFLNKIIKSNEETDSDKDLIAFAILVQLATMIESNELLLFKSKLITVRNYIKQQSLLPWLLVLCDLLSIKERKRSNERDTEKELKEKDKTESSTLSGQYVSYFLQHEPISGIEFECAFYQKNLTLCLKSRWRICKTATVFITSAARRAPTSSTS